MRLIDAENLVRTNPEGSWLYVEQDQETNEKVLKVASGFFQKSRYFLAHSCALQEQKSQVKEILDDLWVQFSLERREGLFLDCWTVETWYYIGIGGKEMLSI